MQRIRNRSSIGINSTTLRNWGMLFLLLGIVGRCILQLRVAGLGQNDLLTILEGPGWILACAIVGILLQAVETCAIPIFAFLLVEGFQRTSSLKNYILRILGTAVLCEIPYNLAYGGKFIDISARNPMFALALGLVLLYFYGMYPEKSGKNRIMKALLTVAAMIWAFMLGVQYGVPVIVLVATIWGCRGKAKARNVVGAAVSMVCSVFSLYMVAAPMGFLPVHFYNQEPSEYNRTVYYLAYPAFLLVVGVVGLFL